MFFIFLIIPVISLLCPDIDLPRKTLTYKNTGNKIENLWKGRIMTPGYNSQNAMNYIAYVFLTEILGMDVSFYPYDEPQFITDFDINGENYIYPLYYFEFIENDDVDLHFETWISHELDAEAIEKYYLPGKIISSVTGIYGEIGWFIPKYFAKEYPKSILIDFINDKEIKDLFISGSNGSYQNTSNYIEYYSNPEKFSSNYRWDFSNRTINGEQVPILWGSVEDYFMSEWSYGVTRNYNISFVTVGSESILNKIIIELYNAKAPFLTNIYIPDDNFATLDNEGNVFKFEKVYLPFNAAQSVNTECFIKNECQYPLEALKKLINPTLYERFPEMAQFYDIFNLNPILLSYLISYYSEIRNEQISENEKWIKASCLWLNDTRVTDLWNNNQWLIEVNRWECIPGCGILTDNNTYIGGTCDFLNPENLDDGTCLCDYDELFGEKCDNSCPGLKTSNNELLFCSGNGICNTESFKCGCNFGFGGEGCEEPFKLFKILRELVIFIISFSSIIIIFLLYCIYWLLKNSKLNSIKILRVNLTLIFSIGLILLSCSNIFYVLNVNNINCILSFWTFGIGIVLSITPPLFKVFRINRIFNNGNLRNDLNISDKKLISFILYLILFEIFLCSIYTYSQISGGIEQNINDEKLEIVNICNKDTRTNLIIIFSYIFYVSLLLMSCYYSYKLRNIKNFKESKCLFFSSFFIIFTVFIDIAFETSIDDPLFVIIIHTFTIFIIIIEILILFYGIRIYDFYKYPEKRNETNQIDIDISISDRDIELN